MHFCAACPVISSQRNHIPPSIGPAVPRPEYGVDLPIVKLMWKRLPSHMPEHRVYRVGEVEFGIDERPVQIENEKLHSG